MKVRIVYIVESMLGGIRQHLFDVINNLDQNKYEIWIIYSDLRADQIFFDNLEKMDKHFHMIRCNSMQRSLGINDYRAYKEILSNLKRITPDIVHCHSSKAGIVGRLAAKKCRVGKIFYTPHAYAFQNPELSFLNKTIYVLAEKILSRISTTKTINVSKGEMEQALRYRLDSKDKFEVIYNGISEIDLVDKNTLKERYGFKNSTYLIGITARCAEQKDPFTWLEIAETVVKKCDQVEFIYIGDGPMQEKMKNWIAEHNMSEYIHLPGFCPEASVMVGMLDIYLSTALYEGMPYSMLEAMRAGVPIIATDTVGNNEIVNCNVSGFLFSIGNVQRAVEQIVRQIEDTVISSDMVLNEFSSKFRRDVMLNKMNDLYCQKTD